MADGIIEMHGPNFVLKMGDKYYTYEEPNWTSDIKNATKFGSINAIEQHFGKKFDLGSDILDALAELGLTSAKGLTAKQFELLNVKKKAAKLKG
jgi:hypothetical protein